MKRVIIICLLMFSFLKAGNFYSDTDNNWNYLLDEYKTKSWSGAGILNADKKTPLHEINQALIDELNYALPEGYNTAQTHPEYFPEKDPEVVVTEDNSEVFVTFYFEGAGYKNTLGFYAYGGDTGKTKPISMADIIANGVIVYPNASLKYSGGLLKQGDTVSLGVFNKDTKLMFFIVSNGWKGTYVRNNQDWIFSTISTINQEYNETNPTYVGDPNNVIPDHKHIAMLWKEYDGGKILILGFEDILRTSYTCDNDFNDVVFSVSSNPLNALDDVSTGSGGFASIPTSTDTDLDGVSDANDLYPEDELRAFESHYPSDNDNTAIAYEDLWPKEGDYDMNDLIVSLHIKEVKNSDNKIKDVVIDTSIQANGAAYKNGFYLKLNTTASNIESITKVTTTREGNVVEENIDVLESNNDGTGYILEIFENAKNHIQHQGDMFANVYESVEKVNSDTFKVTLTLKEPKSSVEFGAPPYNPYIVVNSSVEVHLPNYPYTTRAPVAKFGTYDDNTNGSTTYKSKENRPWAILIPTTWKHPLEKVNIKDAYIHYSDWVNSNGAEYTDWYDNTKVDSNQSLYGISDKIYSK